MRFKVVVLFLVILSWFSCTREFSYDYTDKKEMLYVSAQLSNRDTAFVFYMSLSSGESLKAPSGDSRIECTEGEVILAVSDSTWYCDNNKCIMGVRLQNVVEPGHEYRFDFYSGVHHAHSTVMFEPAYSLSTSLDTISVPEYKRYGAKYYKRFALVFKDISSRRSYYQVSDRIGGIIHFWKEGGTEPVYSYESYRLGNLADDNPVLRDEMSVVSTEIERLLGKEDGEGVAGLNLFSDYLFQDGDFSVFYDCREQSVVIDSWDFYEMRKEEYDYYTLCGNVTISVLPEEQFRYLSLLSRGTSSSDTFLNEPAVLPDNIVGGCGFVGVKTECDVEFDLGRREKH